jgi:AraC family transcriptional regulator, ethanolamine operon transcriptional activator
LQYCFQQAFGINPIAYVRAARLNGVRRAIRAGSGQSTIQDIAAQWGFWHLSHFCEAYKEMFGELPSVTQRHSRQSSRGAAQPLRAPGL